MRRARDEARIVLVLLAHVDHRHRALVEQALELGDVDRLASLRRLDVGHVAAELEEADRSEPASGALRFVTGRCVQHDLLIRIEHEAGARGKRRPVHRNVERPRHVSRREQVRATHVQNRCLATVCYKAKLGWGCYPRAFVQRHDARCRGRARGRDRCGRVHEVLERVERECLVRSHLCTDRGRALRAHRAAAERPRDMSGIDVCLVRELHQPLQRVEEPLGTLACVDGQVWSRRVADEEGISGENEPLADDECAVLRPVPRRVDNADPHRPDGELLSVLERLERKLRVRERMDVDRHAVLEGEPAVAGDVVGVRMGLEHPSDAQAFPFCGLQVGLDCIGRIDVRRLAGRDIADQVGGAAEIVVDELAEQHARTLAPSSACFLEAAASEDPSPRQFRSP